VRADSASLAGQRADEPNDNFAKLVDFVLRFNGMFMAGMFCSLLSALKSAARRGVGFWDIADMTY
jgi:hypothetical protein